MLLTVQEFLKRRPDMEVHMENAIQSAINSSFILLDGECAGLISQVQAYKESGENDTNNEYYRNDFEISQLIEALTSQTQYSLNLGNDYSIGGGSYSIGNINSSYNRPEGRDIVAPGVYKLLSNARVYNLNVGIGVKQNQDHYLEGIDPADKHISISKAQADFVSKYQPNAAIGNVAYVNESKMVSFSRPQDLQIGTYNTNRIAGGEGHRNNYYEIDSVPDIAFFGPNDRGTYSAIQRGEVKQILNDNYLTKEQTLRVIYASGIVWNSRLNYERGWITQEVVNNVLYWYEALEDNTNKRPSQNPSVWRQLEAQSIDLNAIVEQMKPYIDTEINQEVAQQIIEQLNNLPTLEYIEQNREQVLLFNSEQDFINFKNETNTTDRDYENVPFETGTANGVTLDTAQTITGAKTFSEKITISKTNGALAFKPGTNQASFIEFYNSTTRIGYMGKASSSNNHIQIAAEFENIVLETKAANRNVSINSGSLKLNNTTLETGTNIYAGHGGNTVKFIPNDNSTKTLQFYNSGASDTRRFNLLIPEPTQANNPATKSYVDNRIANINSVSLTGNNMWTGDNIFNNLLAQGTYGLRTEVITTTASDKTLTLKANGGRELGNLSVATPTSDNHSANKSYVDTQVNSLNSRVGQLEGSLGLQLRYQDLQLSSVQSMNWGNLNGFYFHISSLQETKFLSAVIHYKGQSNREVLARGWDFNYATTWGPKICFTLKKATNYSLATPDWNNTFIRIFYISTLETLNTEPFSIVEEE